MQHPGLNGEIIDLRGRIRKENGETAVGAKGRVLVTLSGCGARPG
jgi:hypothetical protein